LPVRHDVMTGGQQPLRQHPIIRQTRAYVRPLSDGISVVNTTHSGKPPILAAIAFVALATMSRWRTPLPGDLRLTHWIQGWDGEIAMSAVRFGNWFGSVIPIGVVALLIALAFALRRCWFEAGFMIVAFAAKRFNAVMKAIVDAPRPTPDLARVTEHASGSGFPSGHVMGVALVLGAAALMAHRRFPRLQIPVWTLASAAILITAFGRISVGAHWPSQTLGGLFAAIAVLGLLDMSRGRLEDRHPREPVKDVRPESHG
jgi:membrane-associated phospholipid phosphatase